MLLGYAKSAYAVRLKNQGYRRVLGCLLKIESSKKSTRHIFINVPERIKKSKVQLARIVSRFVISSHYHVLGSVFYYCEKVKSFLKIFIIILAMAQLVNL